MRVKINHEVERDFRVFSEGFQEFFEVVGFRHAPCRWFVVLYVFARCFRLT